MDFAKTTLQMSESLSETFVVQLSMYAPTRLQGYNMGLSQAFMAEASALRKGI